MYLESKDIINRPVKIIYPFVRDQLPDLVPFMPNIEKIEVKEKKTNASGQLELLNYWYAKADIPAVAKKFIKPEILAWKDYAVWDDKTQSVSFSLESFWAKDLYEAKGVNYFTAIDENTTELRVTCEVNIRTDKIPGVPSILVKRILPAVEELVKKILGPNLSSLGKGLNEYFKQN